MRKVRPMSNVGRTLPSYRFPKKVRRVLQLLQYFEAAEPPHGEKDTYRLAFMVLYQCQQPSFTRASLQKIFAEWPACRYAKKIATAKEQRREFLNSVSEVKQYELFEVAAIPKKPPHSVTRICPTCDGRGFLSGRALLSG